MSFQKTITPLTLAASLFCLSPALAYVRVTAGDGKTPLAWRGSNCIHVRVNSQGSDDVKDGSDIAAAKKALTAWREASKKCSYINFTVLPDSPAAKPGFDKFSGSNENVIYWEEKSWTRDKAAMVVTLVKYAPKESTARFGEILDADILLNGVHHKFSTGGAADAYDIQNLLSHEIGLMLGLDNTCDVGIPGTKPKDHTGKAVPTCFSAGVTPAMKAATMYAVINKGETQKRTLEADDVAGACAIYPMAADPGTCQQPAPLDTRDGGAVTKDSGTGGDAAIKAADDRGCSCGVAGGGPGPATLAGVLALLYLMGRRRRPRGN